MTHRSYLILFLAATALILALAWRRKAASDSSFVQPALSLIAVLSFGFFLGKSLDGPELQTWLSICAVQIRDWQMQAPPAIQSTLQFIGNWIETAAGPPGLNRTLSLSLLFMFGYAALRLCLSILFLLVSLAASFFLLLTRILRRFAFNTIPEPAVHFPAILPSHAGFLRSALAVFLALIGAGLAVLPWTGGVPALSDYFAAIFWAGIWVALLEILCWIISRAPWIEGISGEDVETESVDAVRELFYEYQRRHPDQILLAWEEPPLRVVGAAADDPEQLSPMERSARRRFFDIGLSDPQIERISGALRHFLQDHNLLFKESLSRMHFILISECILASSQRGGAVLILCPDGSEEETCNALASNCTPRLLTKALRIVAFGKEETGSDFSPDVIICPGGLLERFVNEQGLSELRAELRLIVALHAERMSRPRLRCQLVRLCAQQFSRPARIFFQAEPFVNAESGVKEIVPTRYILDYTLNPDISVRRYLIVWDNRLAFEKNVKEKYVGSYEGYVDAPMLLCWLPWDRDFGVSYLDFAYRIDRDLIERIPNHITIHFSGSRARSRDWIQLDETALGYMKPSNRVAVTEDMNNLSAAVYHNYHFDARGSGIVCVVSSNYLLRDFITACFHGQKEQGAFRLSDEMLLPRMSLTRIGLTDLARAVQSAASSDAGLRRSELKQLLESFSHRQLLIKLGIDDTPAGCAKLMTEAFGRENSMRFSLIPNTDCIACDSISHTAGETFFLQNSLGRIKGSVPACDIGLRLAQGVYVLIDGKFYYIEAVDAANRSIAVSHQENDDSLRRFRYFFMRTYRIEHLFEAEHDQIQENRGGVSLVAKLRQAHYTRNSTGFIQISEALRPLEAKKDSTIPPYSVKTFETPISFNFHWRNVLEITLANQNSDDAGTPMDKMAFTLCALLQDALYSLFPIQAQYITVVSPQSNMTHGNQINFQNKDELVPLLYPRLESACDADAPIPADKLVLYIIEDGEGDLGVVQSLKNDLLVVLKAIHAYLCWAVNQQESNLYHSFGHDKMNPRFDYIHVKALLSRLFPFKKQPFTAGRPEIKPPESVSGDVASAIECDFCAAPLAGPHEYDKLSDGRQRCKQCSETAVDKVRGEFTRLYDQVVKKMSRRYHITLPKGIQTRFEDPDKIAAKQGKAFVATDSFDPRAVGLAIQTGRNGAEFEILIEHGAPRVATMATLAHELTHIWQFQFIKKTGALPDTEILEGQARYIEIEFIGANGGERLARSLETQAKTGRDIYSRGWRKVRSACSYSPATVFRSFEKMLERC